MKLFFTNREKFENEFTDNQLMLGAKSSYEIHKAAYTLISTSIAENHIHITLLVPYSEEGDFIFEFVKVISDVYFYEYIGTVK